jgi:4-carboxymuconolactone decarboxylase
VPEPLREYAILIAARHWQQNYEWAMHAPLAQRSGVPAALIQALLNDTDRDPSGYASWPEYETVHRFALQLLVEHGVDDATYADARQLLGEAGVIDLCGLLGYYSLLAMVMNVARTPAPAGRNGPF